MREISQALQRFEENKHNPMVRALLQFIQYSLERPLESVTSWGVEVSDHNVRWFYLTFTDGTKISGQLAEAWAVQVFKYDHEDGVTA